MKFEFELDKMPTTQQQKGIKKVNGKLQFYDRRGTNNYSLKAQLMKNKPKECFEKNVPLKLSVTFFLRYQAKKALVAMENKQT